MNKSDSRQGTLANRVKVNFAGADPVKLVREKKESSENSLETRLGVLLIQAIACGYPIVSISTE